MTGLTWRIGALGAVIGGTFAAAAASSPAVTPQPATPALHITRASARNGTITVSGTISPKAAVSGSRAQVILARYLGKRQGYLQLTFGGLLHHHTRFTLRAQDPGRGRRTYAVEFNPYSADFVSQVIVYRTLTIR